MITDLIIAKIIDPGRAVIARFDGNGSVCSKERRIASLFFSQIADLGELSTCCVSPLREARL